jgi:hypothetical protein
LRADQAAGRLGRAPGEERAEASRAHGASLGLLPRGTTDAGPCIASLDHSCPRSGPARCRCSLPSLNADIECRP